MAMAAGVQLHVPPVVASVSDIVKPWHTDVFSPAMLKSAPEKIFSFLEENVLRRAERLFPPDTEEPGDRDVTKVLVLPALPTA